MVCVMGVECTHAHTVYLCGGGTRVHTRTIVCVVGD